MCGVEIVVKKGHNARSCRKLNNLNRKKYPKQPKKPNADISGWMTIFLYTS